MKRERKHPKRNPSPLPLGDLAKAHGGRRIPKQEEEEESTQL